MPIVTLGGDKPWYTSKTIWTNVITAIASLATVWGLDLTPEQQASAVTVIVTIGGLLSSAFRVSATQTIGSSK